MTVLGRPHSHREVVGGRVYRHHLFDAIGPESSTALFTA